MICLTHMTKYKYKVGQIVKYITQKYTEKICPTCGHEETDSKTITVEGKIIKRYYDLVFRIQSITLTDKIETDENGMTIHNPYTPEPHLNGPEPVYEIKRNNQPKKQADEVVCEEEIL